jgi:hypothetical protein
MERSVLIIQHSHLEGAQACSFIHVQNVSCEAHKILLQHSTLCIEYKEYMILNYIGTYSIFHLQRNRGKTFLLTVIAMALVALA